MSNTVFEIGGEKFDVVKKGVAQARQVAHTTQWLSKYGSSVFRAWADKDIASMGGVETIITVLGELDERALIDLFTTIFGCSRELSEQEFSLDLMIDGLVTMYSNSPMIKKLADRFFSTPPSDVSEDSNSMQ